MCTVYIDASIHISITFGYLLRQICILNNQCDFVISKIFLICFQKFKARLNNYDTDINI